MPKSDLLFKFYESMIIFCTNDNFNPFAPNAPFFTPWKQGVKKGALGVNGLKLSLVQKIIMLL